MQPFDLLSPTSLPEALERLAETNGAAKVLAGGTNLIPQMRVGEASPSALVSLRRVPELEHLTFHPEHGLRLGARVTLRRLTRDPLILRHYPILAKTAAVMASEQIRSLATVGGNLCNASPSADLAPPLIVLGGEVVLADAHGERQLPLEAFFLGPGASARRPTELLTEVRLPPPHGEALYLKHAPRQRMDLAVVGVALRLVCADGFPAQTDIALGAVAPVPMRARRAEKVVASGGAVPDFRRAAAIAAEECTPIDDIRASAAYRRRMVEVLVRRGLEALLERGGSV